MNNTAQYKKLLSSFLELKQSSYATLYQRGLTKQEVIHESQLLKKLMTHSKNYIDIGFQNDKLIRFIIAESVKDPFDGHILKCHQFYLAQVTPKKLNEHCQKIYQFFNKETNDIRLTISSNPSKMLQSLLKTGFQVEGQRIYANIEKSLKSITKKNLELSEGFILKKPKINEVNELMLLERCAHLNEPTSVFDYNKADLKEVRKYLLNLIRDDNLRAVYYQGKPIAHVGYLFKQGRGCMATIAVDPSYQGQGLSYILYEYALAKMRENNVSIYTGYTSTLKVLKLGKRLGRKPYEFILKYQA